MIIKKKTSKTEFKESKVINMEIDDKDFEMNEFIWLFFGPPKIGKTTLSLQFPNTYSFFFEPAKTKKTRKSVIFSWNEFILGLKELETDRKKLDLIDTITLDTGATMYELCLEYVCKSRNIQHPGSIKDYGASWKAVNSEFKKRIDFIIKKLKKGLVVVCHEKTREMETIEGIKFEKIVPDLSPFCFNFFNSIADNMFYLYTGKNNRRFIQIKKSTLVECGTRAENHFLDENGNILDKIPMGNSEIEAFNNLKLAFNNDFKKFTNNSKPDFKKKKLITGNRFR